MRDDVDNLTIASFNHKLKKVFAQKKCTIFNCNQLWNVINFSSTIIVILTITLHVIFTSSRLQLHISFSAHVCILCYYCYSKCLHLIWHDEEVNIFILQI